MRLVVFDIDGTLVDSQHEIVEAQARAFAAHGLPAPSRERALSVVGLSLTEAFACLAGPDGPLDSLSDAYRAAWTELRGRPNYADPLHPGAAALVVRLAAAPNVLLGIATGKSRRGVDRILAAQGWADQFATIQTSDTHPSKPDPSMMLAAMAETGVEAAQTIMVGDTTYDMAMASAAEVRSVGVGWGYHEPAALIASGASAIAETFEALGTLVIDFTGEVTSPHD